MAYIDRIKERARQDKKTIILPESTDKRTLIAAAQILQEGIANIIMIGNEEKIHDGAGWLEVDLTGLQVINPSTSDRLEEYVELLYETRKSKGMTMEKAREILLSDYLTFGIVMVKANHADGMVAGGPLPLYGRYSKAGAADLKDCAGYQTGFRLLYFRRSQL